MLDETPAARYEAAWKDFVNRTSEVHGELYNLASRDIATDLHGVLASLHGVPYSQAQKMFLKDPSGRSAKNIGSITGLFFEQLAAALICGYLKPRVAGIRIESNTCSIAVLAAIARDPDLSIHHGTRCVIFEMKVAPKKPDFAYARSLKERYERENARYFLVGGYASLSGSELGRLADERWACLMSSSTRNTAASRQLPTLDDLLSGAATFLQGA